MMTLTVREVLYAWYEEGGQNQGTKHALSIIHMPSTCPQDHNTRQVMTAALCEEKEAKMSMPRMKAYHT